MMNRYSNTFPPTWKYQDSILTCLGTMLHIWCDHSSYDTIYFQDGNTCSRSKVQIAHGTQVLGHWPFTFKPEFLSPDLSPFVKSSSTSKLRTWQVCNHQMLWISTSRTPLVLLDVLIKSICCVVAKRRAIIASEHGMNQANMINTELANIEPEAVVRSAANSTAFLLSCVTVLARSHTATSTAIFLRGRTNNYSVIVAVVFSLLIKWKQENCSWYYDGPTACQWSGHHPPVLLTWWGTILATSQSCHKCQKKGPDSKRPPKDDHGKTPQTGVTMLMAGIIMIVILIITTSEVPRSILFCWNNNEWTTLYEHQAGQCRQLKRRSME